MLNLAGCEEIVRLGLGIVIETLLEVLECLRNTACRMYSVPYHCAKFD